MQRREASRAARAVERVCEPIDAQPARMQLLRTASFRQVPRGWGQHTSHGHGAQSLEPAAKFSFDPLHIEDPLRQDNNVGRNCFRIYAIQQEFGALLRKCRETWALPFSGRGRGPM